MTGQHSTFHLTINGLSLCEQNGWIAGTKTGKGELITCEFTADTASEERRIRRVAKYVRGCFFHSKVILKAGPCLVCGLQFPRIPPL